MQGIECTMLWRVAQIPSSGLKHSFTQLLEYWQLKFSTELFSGNFLELKSHLARGHTLGTVTCNDWLMRGSKGLANGITLKAILAPELSVDSAEVSFTIAWQVKFSLHPVLLPFPSDHPSITSYMQISESHSLFPKKRDLQ